MKKLNYFIQCKVYDLEETKTIKKNVNGYVVDEETAIHYDNECGLYKFTDLKTGLLIKYFCCKTYKKAIELFNDDEQLKYKLTRHRQKDYYLKQIEDFNELEVFNYEY